MLNKWDSRYGDMAELVASWSKDPSTQVGAVIIRPDKSIASVGFNGFPRDMEDRAEWYADRAEKLKRVIHAEHNALNFCSHEDVSGYTVYVYPLMPCLQCASRLMERGIKRVVTVTTPERAEYMRQPDVAQRYQFQAVLDLFEANGAQHQVVLKI